MYYKEEKTKCEEFYEFQERLSYALLSSGFSNAELARKVKVSSSTMSRYISKQAVPSLDVLVRILVNLNLSADVILLGKG